MQNTPSPPATQVAVGTDNVQIAGHHNFVYHIDRLLHGDAAKVAERNRSRMLQLVKKTWIKDVLERSLYRETLIDLGLEDRPDAVQRPWDIQVQMPNQTARMLAAGTRPAHVFDDLNGAFLILGEPGAGKTTMLLELARDLILRAEQDQSLPIPVVFNLSSWSDPKAAIAQWLVDELSSKYGIPNNVGVGWVKDNELLLLLDGLDEVKHQYRDQCVNAINAFRHEHGLAHIVVCSRTSDYNDLANRLNLSGAIVIQPLTPEQINRYFEGIGPELASLQHAIQQNPALQELARQPLMLSIITMAYRDISVEELINEQFETTEDWRGHLFNTYIKRMFDRPGRTKNAPYSSDETTRWLTWLGQKMVEHSQTIFSLDQIRESWLQTRAEERLFRFVSKLLPRALGAINFAILGFAFGGDRPMLRWLLAAAGAVGGWLLFGSFVDDPDPSETLEWSPANSAKGAIAGVLVGSLFGVIGQRFGFVPSGLAGAISGGVVGGALNSFQTRRLKWSWQQAAAGAGIGFGTGVGAGLMGWMKAAGTFAFIYGLVNGISASEFKSKTLPNQGLRQSFKNACIVAIVPILFLTFFLGWPSGVSVGFYTWVLYGGDFVMAHLTIRSILYSKRYTPWNYVAFLDYAVERVFLRKVGGGYIFVHRMLMEHFAGIRYDDKEPGVIAHRAETFRVMGKYAQALSDFNRAIELDDKYAWAFNRRGETYRLMEKYEEAVADFDRALALDKKNVWTMALRGRSYLQMGKLERALVDFNRAIDLDDEYVWAITNRGATYQELGNLDRALADLNRALELNENSAWALILRGRTYGFMHKYEQALADFERAISIDERNVSAIVNRGLTYRLMGKNEPALADFTTAIQLDRYAGLAARAETYRRCGEFNRAIEDFTTALKKEPTNTFLLTRRAAAYRATGEEDAAEADLAKATELLSGNSYRYDRAIILVLRNQFDEALDTLIMEVEQNYYSRVYAETDDLLSPVRNLPRFQAIKKSQTAI